VSVNREAVSVTVTVTVTGALPTGARPRSADLALCRGRGRRLVVE